MVQNTIEQKQRSILVLGATGGVGGAVARAFNSAGFHVKALSRNPERHRERFPDYAWIAGDAMCREAVAKAATGADFIFHGVNPPEYRDWDKLVLPMLESTIAAAKAHNARILFPGTVYNFGPDVFPSPAEDSPQTAKTRKGRIRILMEERLRDVAWEGTQVVLVRAGDFFGSGTGAGNSWFAQMIRPGKSLKAVTKLSAAGVGHQWAYLPDLAETFVRLAERSDDLPSHNVFHFEGFWDRDGEQMIAAIRRASAQPQLKVRHFPWFLVPLLSPFVPIMREIREIRYLWRQPLHMQNEKLVAVLGEEPRTPIDLAVRATLEAYRCLPASELQSSKIKAQARTA